MALNVVWQERTVTVTCPEGTFVVGGGYTASDPVITDLAESVPTSDTTWSVTVTRDAAGNQTSEITPYAICVSA